MTSENGKKHTGLSALVRNPWIQFAAALAALFPVAAGAVEIAAFFLTGASRSATTAVVIIWGGYAASAYVILRLIKAKNRVERKHAAAMQAALADMQGEHQEATLELTKRHYEMLLETVQGHAEDIRAVQGHAAMLERRANALPCVRRGLDRLGGLVVDVQSHQAARAVTSSAHAAALNTVLAAWAEAFSVAVGAPCRIAIKQMTLPHGAAARDLLVNDYARSNPEDILEHSPKDLLNKFTAYREAKRSPSAYYFNNDLVGAWHRKAYRTPHWTDAKVRKGDVRYRSTIVVPIVERVQIVPDKKVEEVWFGFLCVDSQAVDAFDRGIDVTLAAMMAKALCGLLIPPKIRQLTLDLTEEARRRDGDES